MPGESSLQIKNKVLVFSPKTTGSEVNTGKNK